MERNSTYLRKFKYRTETHTAIITKFNHNYVWFKFDNGIGYKSDRAWDIDSFHREWYLLTPLMAVLV